MQDLYYCEFIKEDSENENFDIQSKCFKTAQEAEAWFNESFDYMAGDIHVELMVIKFSNKDVYDIYTVKTLC